MKYNCFRSVPGGCSIHHKLEKYVRQFGIPNSGGPNLKCVCKVLNLERHCLLLCEENGNSVLWSRFRLDFCSFERNLLHLSLCLMFAHVSRR